MTIKHTAKKKPTLCFFASENQKDEDVKLM